jgi:hypothetical protein
MSPDQERLCYWFDWNPDDGTEAFPAAFAKNDAPLVGGSLWGRRVTLSVYAHQWALAVLSRESQEVCFDYEGSWGDFGLTKSWGGGRTRASVVTSNRDLVTGSGRERQAGRD